MDHDLIERQAVVPALTKELGSIINEIMYANMLGPIHEKLRVYGERLSLALATIPSAGESAYIKSSPDAVGALCQGLIDSGYAVKLDPDGTINYWLK